MTQRLCYYKIVKTLFTIISLFFYEDSQLKSCQVKLPQNIPIMLLPLILITTIQCCLVGGTAQLYDLPQLNYWIDIIKCNFLSPYHQSIKYQLPIPVSIFPTPCLGRERKKCDNWEWKSYFNIKSVNVKCIIYIICERVLPKL